MTPSWCRAYTVCSKSSCHNWIWQDKLQPGTRCRRCGTWWPTTHTANQPTKPKPATSNGLNHHQAFKVKPLKRSKVQQEATELLSTAWSSLSDDAQTKLQALGIGPTKPEEPELKDVLRSHMEALPQQVQDLVTKLTTPEPCTER